MKLTLSILLLSLVGLFQGSLAHCQSTQILGTAFKQFSASGLEIPLYQEILLSEPKGMMLKFSGVGTRKKKVVLVSVNVYAAQSYFQKLPTFKADADLRLALKNAGARVMRLTFLRDVGADKIKASFSEALEKNGVDVSAKEIKSFLEKFSFEVKEKETLSFIGIPKTDNNDLLTVESSGSRFSMTAPGIIDAFWSIWYGISADGGLEDLKAELIGKSQD